MTVTFRTTDTCDSPSIPLQHYDRPAPIIIIALELVAIVFVVPFFLIPAVPIIIAKRRNHKFRHNTIDQKLYRKQEAAKAKRAEETST